MQLENLYRDVLSKDDYIFYCDFIVIELLQWNILSYSYQGDGKENEKGQEHVTFQSQEEKSILEDFSNYVIAKDPDIIVCMDESENKIFHYLFARTEKLGLNLQLGREAAVDNNDLSTLKQLIPNCIKGRICLDNSGYRHSSTSFDDFGLAGLIERSRFAFLTLGIAAKYGINRLIDSRNCYELIQRGFVISNNNYYSGSKRNYNVM